MVFWVQDYGFEFTRHVDARCSYCIFKHKAQVNFSASQVYSGRWVFVFQPAPVSIWRQFVEKLKP